VVKDQPQAEQQIAEIKPVEEEEPPFIEPPPPDYYIRNIAILGTTETGKSCLTQRYTRPDFTLKDVKPDSLDASTLALGLLIKRDDEQRKNKDAILEMDHWATIAVEFYNKWIDDNPDNIRIKVQIIDTSGQAIFKPLVNGFIPHADIVLIAYAIDEKETFEKVESWLQDVKTQCRKDVHKILVACKNDIPQREVSVEEGQKKAADNGMQFFETSTLEWDDPKFNDTQKLFAYLDKYIKGTCTDGKVGII